MAAASSDLVVRPMMPDDLPATTDLWVSSWQATYPAIDFNARRRWFTQRIAELEAAGAAALVATRGGAIVGAATVDPRTGYIDQLVVGTQNQRTGVAAKLLAAARERSPSGLALHVNQDNARAIRFYEKHGFVRTDSTINPRSGALVHAMAWTPKSKNESV
jgi:putative acetyltransferase